MEIANEVAEVFCQDVVDKLQVKNVQIIDTAILPENSEKPNIKMNIAISFILGLMCSLAIIFIMEYFDNTIKISSDIEKHLGLPVLGTIPVFPEISDKKMKNYY